MFQSCLFMLLLLFLYPVKTVLLFKKTSEHSGINRTLPKYANRFIWGQIDYEFKKVFKDF